MIKVRGRIRSLDFLTLFRWFIIYSAMGWIYESVFVYLVTGNMENRGFLFGPLCPIYGISILIMILICSDRGKSFVALIIRCALVATAMEYITSVWMEYVFDKRWWDYSNMFLNLNGRICLAASVFFGIIGAVFVRIIHPTIVSITNRFSMKAIKAFDTAILVVFLYDVLLSVRVNIM